MSRLGSVPAPLPLRLDPSAEALLSRPGRSEGIAVSGDGSLLAVVGLSGRIFLARIEIEHDATGLAVAASVSHGIDARTPGWDRVHAVSVVADRLLAIADRRRGLALFAVPEDLDALAARGAPVELDLVLDVTGAGPLEDCNLNGVAAGPLRRVDGGFRVDLVTCDGVLRRAVRHLVAVEEGVRPRALLIDSEVVLDCAGGHPDGAAVSPDGRWLAVADHDAAAIVLVCLDDHGGSVPAEPVRITGPSFPHSLAFADGGRVLVVSDAGAPTVHWVRSVDGSWRDERCTTAVPVMDQGTFALAHVDPSNGGPKGVAVHDRLGIVAVTSAAQRLALFDVGSIVDRSAPEGCPSVGGEAPGQAPADELVARLERRLAVLTARLADDRRRFGWQRRRLDRALRILAFVDRSGPWRLLVGIRHHSLRGRIIERREDREIIRRVR